MQQDPVFKLFTSAVFSFIPLNMMIYLLTAIELTSVGSSTVIQLHIKQYAEQNNETEYTEQNIHNNKNT
jgi:hypothetical protein